MGKTNDAPQAPDGSKPRLKLESMAELCREGTEPEWLVRNIMTADQPLVIGGPPKALKTSLALDLAVSLATGSKFLGTFAVPEACNVAVFSGESGRRTVNETLQRVCRSKEVDPDECGVFCGFTLSRLGSADDRKELRTLLRDNGVGVVIVDPLYLCLCGDRPVAASNLYEVGPVLAQFTDACRRAGATPVFVHHTTKPAGAKRTAVTLGDLAFSGVGEFARQWLLVGRAAEYEPGSGVHELILSVGGSTGQSSQWAVRVDEGRDVRKRQWSLRVVPGTNSGPAVGKTSRAAASGVFANLRDA